jgi:hypothetical protein
MYDVLATLRRSGPPYEGHMAAEEQIVSRLSAPQREQLAASLRTLLVGLGDHAIVERP